jgi:outer membrane protein
MKHTALVLFFFIPLFLFLLLDSAKATVQQPDTIRLSFPEFVERAMEASQQLKARQRQVNIAETRASEARASRYLPNATATTAHGLIPGVKASDPTIPKDQLYLDPGLRNDWEDWAFFNQIELSAIQPLYTWGALSNAIKAAQTGVKISEFDYQNERRKYEIMLFQLYQSKLLSMELQRLIDDARSTLRRAERELDKMIEDGDEDIEESDLYKFDIFKFQFYSQADEVAENSAFVDRAWRLALGESNSRTVFLPETNFLDPLEYQQDELEFYQQLALVSRPEVQQIMSTRQAARFGLDATKAQNYPTLFVGITAKYTFAPNRPRQMNPFITNVTNTSSLTFGFGFRQSLNFGQMRSRTDRSREQLRQADHAIDAVGDGIKLEVADTYKNYMIARSRFMNTEQALDVSRQWLRQEQLDYDIGFGDILNLVDAMKTNLEMEATFKQRIHDFNVNLGRLMNVSGKQIRELYTN